MEQIKKLLGETIVKIKVIIGIIIAGLVVGAIAWRKHVQDELAKDQTAAEQKLKDVAHSYGIDIYGDDDLLRELGVHPED